MNQNKSQGKDVSVTLEDRIFEFLELSQKILTLVQHENAILESCGCLSLKSYLEHRDNLLHNYEKKAESLINFSINEDIHEGTKNLLISELSAVKTALQDNTEHRFKNLESSISLNKGEKLWH